MIVFRGLVSSTRSMIQDTLYLLGDKAPTSVIMPSSCVIDYFYQSRQQILINLSASSWSSAKHYRDGVICFDPSFVSMLRNHRYGRISEYRVLVLIQNLIWTLAETVCIRWIHANIIQAHTWRRLSLEFLQKTNFQANICWLVNIGAHIQLVLNLATYSKLENIANEIKREVRNSLMFFPKLMLIIRFSVRYDHHLDSKLLSARRWFTKLWNLGELKLDFVGGMEMRFE